MKVHYFFNDLLTVDSKSAVLRGDTKEIRRDREINVIWTPTICYKKIDHRGWHSDTHRSVIDNDSTNKVYCFHLSDYAKFSSADVEQPDEAEDQNAFWQLDTESMPLIQI